MRGQAAIKGFGKSDHALEGEVGSPAEELGDIGLADAELAGEVGLANSPAGHDLKRLLDEIHAGGLDLVIERVARPGEDALDAGELLSRKGSVPRIVAFWFIFVGLKFYGRRSVEASLGLGFWKASMPLWRVAWAKFEMRNGKLACGREAGSVPHIDIFVEPAWSGSGFWMVDYCYHWIIEIRHQP